MKNLFLAFAFFLPFFGFSQTSLSGEYIIKSTQSSPFNNIYNAINHLNTVGLTNSVIFLLDDDYTLPATIIEPITITPLKNYGSNTNATLTIKPNVGRSLVTLTASTPQNNGQIRQFFKIDRADNIIIDGSSNGTTSRNLVIRSAHQNNYNDSQISSSLIWIASSSSDACNNNTFKNIAFEGFSTNQNNATTVGFIFSNNETISNPEGKGGLNNSIVNNEFIKLKTAIQVTGNSASLNDGLIISNNTFGSTDSSKRLTRRGIRLSNVKNFTVSNNMIDGIFVDVGNTENFSGILIEGNSSNGSIFNNNITNITKTTGSIVSGITLDSSNSNSNIEIVNNMISKISSPGNNSLYAGTRGILISSGGNYRIYYNSILSNSLLSSGSEAVSAALFIHNGVTALNIRNNIFINSQTTGKQYAIYSEIALGAFTSLNYNNYFAQNLGYINGTIYTSLATALGANSKNINPAFVSSTDLKLQDVTANDPLKSGLPISGITTDIEGDIRSTTSPTMGADEILTVKCSTSTTWDGTAWSNGTPNDTKKAIIAGNYSGESFIACELQINSGVITIGADKYIQVVNDIVNNGTLVLENTASLIQTENDATYTGNEITVKKVTAPMKRYDFTYWSSPVANFKLYTLSPATLGDKFYSYNPASGWVIHYNGDVFMEKGRGYIVRAPQSFEINNAAPFPTQFVGIPNTGTITQSVALSSNLIGNPYPSAISADEIYKENSSKINGTFYFWTHNSLPSSANSGDATYNYTSDDYASYNIVGGVKTKVAAISGGAQPTGNIASGQSFFVTGIAAGTITFTNSMRVKGGNNSQFFRSGNATESQEPVTIEKHRFWLNISNEAGAFNETLVGYISNATNGLDAAFDGASFSSGNVTLYSIIDNKKLVIQGRALPFTNQDIVPLGMNIGTAGQYTINMDQFDGLFTNQDIYLFDKLNNTYHNLKNSNYTFTSAAGTFNSRFEIRYVDDSTLGIDTPLVSENDIVVYRNGNQIGVRARNLTIDTVQVYDITGKLITSGKNISSSTFTTAGMNVATQVLIVKVTLDNNQTVSKKVIMN